MMQIGPQKYPFKKQNGTTLNPATEETSTSILGFVSTVYDWFVSLFPWDLVAARQTARNITDQQIIPAANAIIHDRGIALPRNDYYIKTIVGDTVTYAYSYQSVPVATVTVVYTDTTLTTISTRTITYP